MIRLPCRAMVEIALLAAACLTMPSTLLAGSLPDSHAATGSGSRMHAIATPPALDVWIYPAIRGYGGVRPRPDLPSGISPSIDYRVIVDVVHGETDHARVLGSLERLARLVNLMAYAGVPRNHVHFAAVIEGTAGFAALTSAAYRKRFNVDNPNLPLLHALRGSGVELMICAQALAENGLKDSDVSPDVAVTLSALTDFVIYGQRGYSYLQL